MIVRNRESIHPHRQFNSSIQYFGEIRNAHLYVFLLYSCEERPGHRVGRTNPCSISVPLTTIYRDTKSHLDSQPCYVQHVLVECTCTGQPLCFQTPVGSTRLKSERPRCLKTMLSCHVVSVSPLEALCLVFEQVGWTRKLFRPCDDGWAFGQDHN